MNSLRTDDIIGAVPRVRHMPKNLYRGGSGYGYSIHGQYDDSSPIKNVSGLVYNEGNYNKGKWDHSYNENMYNNFPLSQYDPNPFIRQNPNSQMLTMSRQRTNSMNVDEYRQSIGEMEGLGDNRMNGSRYEGKPSRELMGRSLERVSLQRMQEGLYEKGKSYMPGDGSMMQAKDHTGLRGENDRNENISRDHLSGRVKAKQAVVINYDDLNKMRPNLETNKKQDSVEQMKTTRQNEQLSSHHASSRQGRNSLGQQPIGSNQKSKDNNQSRGQQRSRKERSIFRGIGFNIITNSKYQYSLQTSVPHSSRVG